MSRSGSQEFYLEQYALGELKHRDPILEKNPDFNRELEKLEESNRTFLEKYPADEMADRIRKRLNPSQLPGWKTRLNNGWNQLKRMLFLPVLAPAAAALLAFFLFTPESTTMVQQIENSNGDTILLRGIDSSLSIYRRTGEGAEVLEHDEKVYENDLLQMGYISGGKPYGAIFSLDGNGTVTLHYPESPYATPRLDTSGEILLDYSYRLDDAPDYETFFFITSSSPFNVNALLRSITMENNNNPESLRFELDQPWDEVIFNLKKGDRP